MGDGFLNAFVYYDDSAVPVSWASVIISDQKGKILHTIRTNGNGQTVTAPLDAPSSEGTLDPSYRGPTYAKYNIDIFAKGFENKSIRGVQIFEGRASNLPIRLYPLRTVTEVFNEIDIPENLLKSVQKRFIERDKTQSVESQQRKVMAKILDEVTIPTNIVVHLGKPTEITQNVTVSFVNYIKNVASSEIYPTWPEESLKANIYCQISLALNRIYTEWYRGRGYTFDITNSTQFDQFFVYGRNVFDNISNIVDDIFNEYITRKGRKEPFYAEYCNGTTSTCPGLSQWGTVDLAKKGYKSLEILRYYYPDDVIITATNNIQDVELSYPGTPLKVGDNNDDVKTMQLYLNRIRTNYPLIPLITNPNGSYQADTKEAVDVFQKTFSLIVTGVIGKETWYRISSVYSSVKKLAELGSEGEYIGIGAVPPISTIKLGAKGEDVVQLQFLLLYISSFVSTVQNVVQTGLFDRQTEISVTSFQKTYYLLPDGIVGPSTWKKLYEIYYDILENTGVIPTPPPEPPIKPNLPPYPGTSLKVGSRGEDVKIMQQNLNVVAKAFPSINRVAEDGVFGLKTRESVVEFQKLFGLTPDGVVGVQTWNRIMIEAEIIRNAGQIIPERTPPYPGTPLKVGSTGNSVLLIQRRLNKIRVYYPTIPKLVEDGIFGNGTKQSVIEFQKLFNLTPDGIVGQKTWDKINEIYSSVTL